MSNDLFSYEEQASIILESSNLNDFENDNDVILYYTLNFINYNTANDLCYLFIKSESTEYKNIGIVCVGHLARLYKQFPSPEILAILEKNYADANSEYWRVIDDTLDDMSIFLGIPKDNVFRTLHATKV